ncbi:MAG: hypothetical protein IJT33_04375, partial [Campylobacter sp.]|nr:hypothetical protein [Campylobacter sp.]
MRRNFKFSIAAAVAITAVSANLALADDHRYEIYLNSANQLVYDLYNDAYPSTLIGSGYSITGDFDKGEIVSVGANGSHNANTIEVKLGSSGSFGGKNIIVGEYQDEDVALNIIEIVSGTDFGNIIGGKSSTGDVSSNAITFSLGANNSAKANDIIASQSDLGGANGNVDIRDSVVTANNIYGAKSISGLVKNAGVWLDRYSKIAISGSIYGGSSKDGIATGNQVDIWSRGSILGNVYGGKSENGKADGNLLKISNADIALYKDIYGGSSDKSDAIKNKVSILDGVLLGNTYGGYSNSGNTQENSVAINGGRIDYEVYGGYSNSGNAQENSVSISGGRASWKIYGGYSNSGNAYGNSVVISNGTTMAIVGGETNSGKAYNNNISISGGTIGQGVESLIGGRSTNGNAENNSVEISGGTLLANVEGGYSDTGNAVGNSVVISGGTIGDVQHPNGVVGGISYKGDAIGNSVTISGGTINGDVFGGTTTYGKSIDNKVYYTGGNILEDIYGGSNSFDISGNELFIGTAQTPAIGLSARNVYWFETINFYLPNSVKY